MEDLLAYITKGLVSSPDEVNITPVSTGRMTVYEISVGQDDVGKIIGRQGKVIRAIRTLAKASATRAGTRVDVDVV